MDLSGHPPELLTVSNYIPTPIRDSVWYRTPIPLIAALLAYILFVKVLGPAFMKYREPFVIKRAITVYNTLQIGWNLYIVYLGYKIWDVNRTAKSFDWMCIPINFRNAELQYLTALMGHYYFLNKVFDLTDTVFFVLRKKFNQASFLHVYHHVSTAILVWLFMRYYGSGNVVFGTILNSFVHAIMYGYYQITLMKWNNTERLKKYLTQLQMVQLAIISFHLGALFFHNPCNLNLFLHGFLCADTVLVFYLFASFYMREYVKKKEN